MKMKCLWAHFVVVSLAVLSLAGCPTDGESREKEEIVIEGIAPVAGATPVLTIAETSQHSGATITWSPEVSGTFASNTVYTASFIIELKGYTFATASVEVTGSAVGSRYYYGGPTQSKVTAEVKFKATDKPTISIAAIEGVIAPATGATPVLTISETDQYSCTYGIRWSPEVNGTFTAYTVYTAIFRLYPKEGYTLKGLDNSFFTVAGAETSSVITSGGSTPNAQITAVFPLTGGNPPAVIDIPVIAGVTAPVAGAAPVAAITERGQYSGTVTWSPAVSGTFAAATAYTATITLTEKEGYTLQGVPADFFTVAGATSDTNAADSGIITAVFPETAPAGAALIFYWENEQNTLTTTSPDTEIRLSKTDAAEQEITVNGSGYNSLRWFINGAEDIAGAGQSTYTFTSSVREIRDYTLTLLVEKDGEYYSANFTITVTE